MDLGRYDPICPLDGMCHHPKVKTSTSDYSHVTDRGPSPARSPQQESRS